MVMPGLNGCETFLKLRAIDPGVQVIICSGYDRSGKIEELLSEGGVAFLQKPYRIGEISQVLKSMIGDKSILDY
jgi:two-component system cell cycle sensor histidine kinase/response regulator CckA